MSCFQWCTRSAATRRVENIREDAHGENNDEQQQEETPFEIGHDEERKLREHYGIKFVHFTLMTPNENVIDILSDFDENIQVSLEMISKLGKLIIHLSDIYR